MEHRYLGRSGLKVSAISYGNCITHGSQVDDDTAIAAVHEALDQGITTFDTADVYAGTRAEAVMGTALAGQRRESLELARAHRHDVDVPEARGGPGIAPKLANHVVHRRSLPDHKHHPCRRGGRERAAAAGTGR